MKKNMLFLAFMFMRGIPVFSQQPELRALNMVYPRLNSEQWNAAFSTEGLTRSGKGSEGFALPPQTGGNSEIPRPKNVPSFIVETLRVIPNKQTDLLSVYNALNRIGALKGRTYHSFTRDKYIPLFEEAVRLESDKRMNVKADPPPFTALPAGETIFARLKDSNFGNCYYEITLESNSRSILCTLTNFKAISYMIFPVIKEKNFTAVLYLEPAAEGLLVYSFAAANVSDFAAKQISLPGALEKRLGVIIGWVLDGIR